MTGQDPVGKQRLSVADLAALREAVYRPTATQADVLAYEAALRTAENPEDADTPTPPDAVQVPPRPSPRARRLLLTALVGSIAALLAAVWSMSTPHVSSHQAPSPAVGPRSTPIPFSGSRRQQQQQRADLQALFDADPRTAIRSYLLSNGLAGLGQLRSDVHTVTGAATGTASFDLGALSNGAPTGQLTLLFVCDRPARYRWTLSAPGALHDDPTAVTGSGRNCFGHVVAASFEPRVGRIPQKLTLAVPAGTRVLIEVDLARE